MPVFTETATAPSGHFLDLVATCACTCLSDSDYGTQDDAEDDDDCDELFDRYRYTFNTASGNPPNGNNNGTSSTGLENGCIGIGRGGLFILINGARHWSGCAVFTNATNQLSTCSAVVPFNSSTSSSAPSSCLTYSAVVSSSSNLVVSPAASIPSTATVTTSAVEALALLKRQYQHLQLQRLQKRQQRQMMGGVAMLKKPPVEDRRPPLDMFDPVRMLPSRNCHLYAGNRFQGKQKSGNNSYDVVVDIKVHPRAHKSDS